MDHQGKHWSTMKHEPAKRSDVLNLIRGILEKDLQIPKDLKKPLLNLGLGEPNKANGFELAEEITNALIDSVQSGMFNSYTMSSGNPEGKEAVANKFSTPDTRIDPKNVFLTYGCSGALYQTFAVLCEKGDNFVVPSPGFPLCHPIAQNLEVEIKHYNLLPEKDWEIDLEDLRSKIDSKTKAIYVINPSNPCGSTFSKEHMLEIIKIADEFKLPIVADEVYYGLVYGEDSEFHSFGNLTKDVPVICCGAISKIYCVPGWRVGWIIVYNNHGYLDDVLINMNKQSMIQLHPSHLVLGALPAILKNTPESFFTNLKAKLKDTADFAFQELQGIRGIKPTHPKAAMYMMINIDLEQFADIVDDVDFSKKLLHEEAVLVFPSQCFFAKNSFRIIVCTSKSQISEFVLRLKEFCQIHYKD